MKTLLLFVLLIPFLLFGQQRYEPVIIDQCSGEVLNNRDVYDITIYKGDTQFRQHPFLDFSGYSLTEKGRHVMLFSNSYDSVAFHFDPNAAHPDTFYLPALETWFMVSSPPIVTYSYCGENADGVIEDYYYNGNLRKRGTFDDGQLIDTLFTYHSNGQLSEVMVDKANHGFSQITYYENGQLKNHYNSKKRIEEKYYQNGQISEDISWNKRHKYRVKTYQPNGSLSSEIRKDKKFYFQNDTLKSILKTRRQLSTMLHDWFSLKRSFAYGPWHNCTWKHFNADGELIRKEKFQEPNHFRSNFPDSLGEDQLDLVHSVLFYSDGKRVYKIESDYRKVNGEFKSRIICYRREGNNWIEESESDDETLLEKITLYSSKTQNH